MSGPDSLGWAYGRKGNVEGLFPASYIKFVWVRFERSINLLQWAWNDCLTPVMFDPPFSVYFKEIKVLIIHAVFVHNAAQIVDFYKRNKF
jgi:hypothetical protein